jgi:hypothetical protein
VFWKKFFKKDKSKYTCATCGKCHEELPALGFDEPGHYAALNDTDKNEIAEISSDFCIIRHPEQTDRFIRAVMTIQINDACENLEYGLWVSLSEKSYVDYEEYFKKDREEKTYFGTICNEVPCYEKSSIGLHVSVSTRNGGIRPDLIPYESDHPLIADWENGISIKEAERRIEEAFKTANDQ